ncbi:glycosyltransferase [Lutimonas zeaxanthinifaciens]|uniref:glycosyltransferase n=1 Tax=Lutimonas zeaxanthinifaciens TaxID=3060215 RepID=UPI00265CCA19|nr:glycosyltransferase [Lutimonas sp. YSD2104]WKK64868.1 glycosyltransferase [Lutimonas sp. YSD2104]
MQFSIIIPVFNRPEELDELLESLVNVSGFESTEVIIVEDGSTRTSREVVKKYEEKIDIKYCFKSNSGPGDSRNYGMQRASGNYFIILDSDCLLPSGYLDIIKSELKEAFVDAYGGPDAAHESFSRWQKAINYSMTSFLTTGGLRNRETSKRKFQLRSFNMGLSKRAFHSTGGFSKQRIGEDIDLNFKLIEKGFSLKLIPEAFVYHKRRTSWLAFFRQTRSFGRARPILNKIHVGTAKLTYWFPTFFVVGLVVSLLLYFAGLYPFLLIYLLYTIAVFTDAMMKSKNVLVSILSVLAVYTQFFGYGLGFAKSMFRLNVRRMDPREAFPAMFS